jgi:hypothetical protein
VSKPKYQLNKGPTTKCPHCGGGTEIRTSREIDTLIRDVYFMCRDHDCGHQFVAQLTIKHSIVASNRPRVGLNLPMFEPNTPPKPANDDAVLVTPGVPANDVDDGDDGDADTTMTTPG